jgi:queuine tRNA-ribosyltransferase
MVNFQVLHQDSGSSARLGLLQTAHGHVETPVFMPVGTAGAVKGITPHQLKETGAGIILSNTYHLLLRPGIETIEKLGGLHKFMAWDRPILTDSGGYQVFSLISLTKIDDDGVEFASHIDGAKTYLNAEIAIDAQNRLAVDIIMCFDQCTPSGVDKAQLEKAVERTILWAKRCKKAHRRPNQMLFAIVQGGTNRGLRTYCCEELLKTDFDGYAVGGLSVGEGYDETIATVRHTTSLLPAEKPRYLMGVGTPGDIISAVMAGIDMFDCVLPTRNGRNAFAFTENGPLRLRNNSHIEETKPIEDGCDCYCCTNFSRGTLRHFFNSGEMLGPILVSVHNLTFYQRFMAKIRQAIKTNKLAEKAKELIINY